MDCPAGTVMSRLYRGRKILQGLLHDYAVEQGIIQRRPQPASAPATAQAPVDIGGLPAAARPAAQGRGRRRELRRAAAPRFRPTSTASWPASIASRSSGTWSAVPAARAQVHLRGAVQGGGAGAPAAAAGPAGAQAAGRGGAGARRRSRRAAGPGCRYPRLVPAAAAVLLIVGITSTVRQSQSDGARAGAAQLPGRDADGHHRLGLRLDRLLVPRPGRLPGARPGARRRRDLPGRAPGQRGRASGRLPASTADPSGHRVALLVFDPRDEAARGAAAPGDQRPRDLPRERARASRPPPTATAASATW